MTVFLKKFYTIIDDDPKINFHKGATDEKKISAKKTYSLRTNFYFRKNISSTTNKKK